MTKRDTVFPAKPHALYEAHKISPAIRSGNFLYVSGQVGAREDGTPEPDYRAQVQLAFDNLNAVLAAAGLTFDDVVDVTSFHTDPEKQFSIMMEIRDAEIGEAPYPTWTAIGVTWLAGFDFELKVVARLPTAG